MLLLERGKAFAGMVVADSDSLASVIQNNDGANGGNGGLQNSKHMKMKKKKEDNTLRIRRTRVVGKGESFCVPYPMKEKQGRSCFFGV